MIHTDVVPQTKSPVASDIAAERERDLDTATQHGTESPSHSSEVKTDCVYCIVLLYEFILMYKYMYRYCMCTHVYSYSLAKKSLRPSGLDS